jgi:isoleucyl-tRNA synthetase
VGTQELNVRLLTATADEDRFVLLKAEPNLAVLGKRLGKAVKTVGDAVRGVCQSVGRDKGVRVGRRGAHRYGATAALTPAEIKGFLAAKTIVVAGATLGEDDVKVTRAVVAAAGNLTEANGDGDILLVLDCTNETALVEEGLARELVNRLQKLRKKVCGIALRVGRWGAGASYA